MKHLLYALALLLLLVLPLASCTENKTDEQPAELKVESLLLTTLAGTTLETVELDDDNASFDFRISVQPSNSAFKAEDFELRTENGGVAEHISFTIKSTSYSSAIASVADNSPAGQNDGYNYRLRVHHTPTGVISERFTVSRTVTPKQPAFALSLVTLPETLEVGQSAALEIEVDPADVKLESDRFLLLTGDNKEPQYLALSYENDSEGLYRFTLTDLRTEYEPYEETLKIVYEGPERSVATKNFTVRSAELQIFRISKVYITLDDGCTRAKDLDAKTSSISGYKDDGSNFENQVKNDNREWVDAKIRIEGAEGFDDLAEMDTKIKGRGNTTWGWPKKPYNLKLDKKSEVLGMKKHKRWCLIANAIDRTHMRNWLAYNISQKLSFDYAVHDEFVELYFINADGSEDYRGLYMLSEHIKEDMDSRVPLTEVKETKTGVAGDAIGFLLEFDMNYDEPGRFLTSPSRLPVNIKYPAQEDWEAAGNMEQYDKYKNYISEYVSDIDKRITSLASGGDSSGIWEKLDIESMANFWIVFETMSCREVLWPKSIYFHKEAGQKLKAGPTWDFDYRTLNASDATSWINYYQNTNSANTTTQYWSSKSERTWWAQLIKKDKTFREEIKKQWAIAYPKMLAIHASEFETQKALLEEADQRNAAIWKQSSISGNPNSDASMTFENAVNTLKNNFKTRIDWLNTQINSWN